MNLKITSFNPMIVTKDAENVMQLFEELGFQRQHTKEGISDEGITSVRMKDANGFHVDVADGNFPEDRMIIRMNVDNMEEAIELLTAHGFRRARVQAFSDTVDTPSSRFNIMVSPSGFIVDVIQHIKK
jgi:pentose-5-phosphate-3-epimerase